MAFLKVLSCSLIFIIAAALFIDEHISIPKLDILYPQLYNIHFVLDVNYDIFHGEYNVSIYIPYETQNIYVYKEKLSIIGVRVTNDTQISKENNEEPFAHEFNGSVYNTETRITTISFPYNLSLGFYTLNMQFIGLLAENGGFRTFYMNQQNDRVWLAATHYYKFATRSLFPLLKDTIYASYNISIKHHITYTALSNMNNVVSPQKVNVDKSNMQWTRFKTTPVMPVYFLTMGIVRLDCLVSLNIRLFCRKDMLPHVKFAHTVATDIAWFLKEKLPNIRKTLQTNHIVIPELFDAEEIMLGFILYREADIIFNQETDSEIRKIEIVRIMGYKVVHEWFYHAIDPYKWEPWLSKGFATFFGIYAADKTFPHFRIQDFSMIQMQHDFLHWSTKDTWPLTSEFNSSFQVPRYIKASVMFRTLQYFSQEPFRYCIEIYLKYCYTSSSDFWNEIQAVMYESSFKNEMKYKLKDKITNWTQLSHYPVINVHRDYDKNKLDISVEDFNADIRIFNIITQTSLKKILIALWLVPHISYHSQIITDFEYYYDSVLVNSQNGCYRVNYDAENWRRLLYHLNSKFFGTIHVLDRAKIIDDTFHFLMTGRINSTVFLNISHYLGQDTDYIAWYPMFKNLEYMSGLFAFPESEPIKEKIMQPLNKILSKIKYPDFKPDRIIQESVLTKRLRQDAARWLCTLSYSYCLSIANDKLKSYLLNRNESSPYKIWTGWKEWTFCNGLMTATNYTWMQVFDIYFKESDHSVLNFLACSKSFEIIFQYMHLIMGDMRTNIDNINRFCIIVASHAKNTSLLHYILNDLERIKPKEISLITALTMIINYVYSKAQINEIKKYMEINLKDNLEFARESIKREYLQESIIMYVNRKLELRWHQIKTQLYEYRYLIKDFGDIFKEYFAD